MSFGWAIKEPLLIVTKVVDNAREDLQMNPDTSLCSDILLQGSLTNQIFGRKISNCSMKIIFKIILEPVC